MNAKSVATQAEDAALSSALRISLRQLIHLTRRLQGAHTMDGGASSAPTATAPVSALACVGLVCHGRVSALGDGRAECVCVYVCVYVCVCVCVCVCVRAPCRYWRSCMKLCWRR